MAEETPTTPITPTVPTTPTTPVVPTTPTTPTTPIEPITTADKLKDKTPEELVKMYGDAERKIGELSSKDKQNDELIRQMNVILAAIGDSPDREELVKNWINGYVEKSQGKKTPVETKKEEPKPSGDITDVRHQQENEITRRFEEKYGINKLDAEKRKEMNGKIGNALWAVADPLGKYEKWEDLLAAIPITKLEDLMERAYFEANRGAIEAKIAEAGEIPGVTMGRIAGATLPTEEMTKLTANEEQVAKKLGISSEKYLERKKQREKGDFQVQAKKKE